VSSCDTSQDRASNDAPVMISPSHNATKKQTGTNGSEAEHIKSYGDRVPGQGRQPAVSSTESMLIT
jgi:hypothetical protein